MDQRALVERARGGDHDAFTTLLDVRLARLDAAARLILRDPELARDAVQEASSEPGATCPGLRDPDRFDAWLHRLIVNACLDLVRRRRRRVIEVELTPIDMPTASDAAGALADRQLLDDALGRLDPGIGRSSPCTTCSGCRCRRWRRRCGIPLGTAKSRLHYALAAMRHDRDRPSRDLPARSGRAARMTSPRRFEQDLPALLGRPLPRRDARLPRRPRPSRPRARAAARLDLPRKVDSHGRRDATTAGRRASLGGRSACRPLIVLLAAATLLVVVGSRHRVPPPFGPAGNGPIAYGATATSSSATADRRDHAAPQRARPTRRARQFAGRHADCLRPDRRRAALPDGGGRRRTPTPSV